MKLIVGSAALDELGTAFSFVTALGTDGSTLYVRGGGDVLLAQPDVDDAAATVRALGMTSFPGGLIGDATHFTASSYPDGWQVDDLSYDYAAPVSALAFGDNALHISLTPAAPGESPSVAILPDGVTDTVHNDATTGAATSDDTSDLRLDWTTRDALEAIGSVPARHSPVTLDGAMLDPARDAMEIFATTLARNGIAIGAARARAATPPAARMIWQHRSPQLPDLLASMWLPSDNLLAESLLEELGASAAPNADTRASGIARERAWLQRIGVAPASVTIADGSGLSIYDRVTPRAIVAILAHDWHGPNRAAVIAALPVAGTSGTLKDAFAGTELAGNVIAKTGSTTHNRTLAGYLRTPRGTVIFALMINDWMDTGSGANERLRAVQQRFLERIRNDPGGVS